MSSPYSETKKYLDSFINYERQPGFSYKKTLKLERVKFLLSVLGVNYQSLKAIHIAGTKGKGSTSHFCADLLAASGLKTGLYTSPHFFDFRERIKIVHSPKSTVRSYQISKKDITRIVEEFRSKLEEVRVTKDYGKLSFFEVYTAVAFKYFIDKEVDFVVLETGLGGRLDATNVINPSVSVICPIGYDHIEILGQGLKDIAYEKAGIIKERRPVVCFNQRRPAYGVIQKVCRQKRADLFVLGKDFKTTGVCLKRHSTVFNFQFGKLNLMNLKIYLKGMVQVYNAAAALAAVKILKNNGLLPAKNCLREGLAGTFIEGRFELACKEPLIILDIAHNPSSFSALNENIKTYYPGREVILIFSASQGKDVKNMLKFIDYTKLILTKFSNPRCLESRQIRKICKLKEAVETENIKEAFKAAWKLYNKGSVIVVSGSFFLVSEAKKLMMSRCRIFEDRR